MRTGDTQPQVRVSDSVRKSAVTRMGTPQQGQLSFREPISRIGGRCSVGSIQPCA